jgi:DNA polymerase-3 subunit alpha (Gram-positive type)
MTYWGVIMSNQDLSILIGNVLTEVDYTIAGIKYYKSKRALEVDIMLEELIPFQTVQALESTITQALPFLAESKVNKQYQLTKENFVDEFQAYWQYLLDRLGAKHPSLSGILKDARLVHLDSGVEVHITDTIGFMNLSNKGIDRGVQGIVSQEFSFPFDVQFICDEDASMENLIAFEEEKLNIIQARGKALNEAAGRATPREAAPAESKVGGNSGGGGYKRPKREIDETVIYKYKIKSKPVPIDEGMIEESQQCFMGEIFDIDTRTLKSGKTLMSLSISDKTNSIGVKAFLKENEAEEVLDQLSKGMWILVDGNVRYDTFEKELCLYINNINHGQAPPVRMDNAEEKRVELHLHSNMSDMDGITPIKDLVKRAIKWGHPAIAITDHGVLQAFPDAQIASKGSDTKMIYGVEGYLIDDDSKMYEDHVDYPLTGTYVVFDIETTGFSPINDGITEIGAVKVINGSIEARYSTFVNPEKTIPAKVVELTGITNDMVARERPISEVLPEFLEFCGDAALVAHNASFDVSFIREKARRNGVEIDPIVVDTLALAKLLLPELKRHKLNQVAKYLKISLENHHRAVDDANATAAIYLKFLTMMKEEGISVLSDLNKLALERMDYTKYNSNHVIILAKNQDGIKDLYKIVSHSNIKTYYKTPRIPKSLLSEMREHLLIGSACEAGELFKALLSGATDDELDKVAAFYDYLEIQPIGNNNFMIAKGIANDEEDLRNHNRKIVAIGERLNKPVVATCDVHFMEPEDEVYRRILMAGKGFSDADNQPPLYFRTTDEMMAEFDYLGPDKCKEVVITNTNKIADMIEATKPVPDETSPPVIEGSDVELREMCFAKARRIYGDDLPEIVHARLERELNSIIGNGYAVMYIIAQKLVTKSLEDGYLVGSRGSVGSSFAATMSDITEVNPLAPHYVCKECKHSEFITDGSYGSGADLPDKDCPNCNIPYIKDGHEIPFEVFLGFEGDKEPDIDLNFAGVYQATSHKYTEELFGEGYVYKAGTIGTIADKTAFGFVKKYYEEKEASINSKEVLRLSTGCTGVKRTSGQHPGGIMVIPSYKDVHDFCPIQYPANDSKSGVITTHFDYHSLSGRILKLDILGHDVPTIIKDLEEITGVDIFDVPLDDQPTVKIFTSTESLKIVDDGYKETIGSLGIPEFGTKFVRQMLVDTQPSTFDELVRISGLSHGTDVWLNNAQDLVRAGTTSLKSVIATRDDIMNYLIHAGLPNKEAFTIMERVRKGKGLTDENIALMKENEVPEWYIWSCNQIKYMFPKAHAVAYVMMSFRIAYFKVHHPLAFYATYYTIKVDDFDAQLVCQGKEVIREKMKNLETLEFGMSKKEGDLYTILEVANEMYSRGFKLKKVDLYESDAEKFKVVDDMLLPPLVALQGVGINAAKHIAEEAKKGEFLSQEDMRMRAKATKTVIEALKEHGCLGDMPETNQLSLF